MTGPVLLTLRFILTASLYLFLGWMLLTLWRDMQHQPDLMAARRPVPLTLTSLEAQPGVSQTFTSTEVVIGRDPACACVTQDPTVSSQHTRLRYRQSQWWVEDLRSTNGTFLNNEPIKSPAVVTHGDQLRCGQLVFMISIGE